LLKNEKNTNHGKPTGKITTMTKERAIVDLKL